MYAWEHKGESFLGSCGGFSKVGRPHEVERVGKDFCTIFEISPKIHPFFVFGFLRMRDGARARNARRRLRICSCNCTSGCTCTAAFGILFFVAAGRTLRPGNPITLWGNIIWAKIICLPLGGNEKMEDYNLLNECWSEGGL